MKYGKSRSVLFVLALVFLLTACGGGNKKNIVGTWHIVDEATQTEYGLGIEFEKDGTLRYGLTEELLTGLSDADEEEVEDAMAGLDMLMSMEYEIKSDTEMEVTMKAFLGLAKESATVQYKLDGDTLIFDGATYTRVK